MPPNPNLPDWRSLLAADAQAWAEACGRAVAGARVLIATGVGGGTAIAMCSMESMLGVALTLAGARVEFLACDQALPACKNLELVTHPDPSLIEDYGLNSTELCCQCSAHADHLLGGFGLPLHRLSPLIDPAERFAARQASASLDEDQIRAFRRAGVALGEHAWAGALRYFARGDLCGEARGRTVAQRYLEAAILTQIAFERLLDRTRPDVVVSSHGLYVPYGIFAEICRTRGVRYAAWNIAYRKRCLIFSHGDSYHHTMLDEPTDLWEGINLRPQEERALIDYLASRLHGSHDWIWFHEKEQRTAEEVWADLGLADGRPVIGLLTNVVWDAQLHYRANAYATMMDWVLDTVDYFAARSDLHLLIRVHPAEVRGTLPSRQRVVDELRRARPQLPSNVHIVAAETPVSTYALMDRCDAVAIYGTKTGVELTSMGIPVIVAGEAWIRNKGISDDASSPSQYRSLLDQLPRRARLNPDRVARARRYAWHFFFQRMIPVHCLEPVATGWPPFRIGARRLGDLAPGVDPGLDLIVRGILTGAPFVFTEQGHHS